jgi:hypothetical protein
MLSETSRLRKKIRSLTHDLSISKSSLSVKPPPPQIIIQLADRCPICGAGYKGITFLDQHIFCRHQEIAELWQTIRTPQPPGIIAKSSQKVHRPAVDDRGLLSVLAELKSKIDESENRILALCQEQASVIASLNRRLKEKVLDVPSNERKPKMIRNHSSVESFPRPPKPKAQTKVNRERIEISDSSTGLLGSLIQRPSETQNSFPSIQEITQNGENTVILSSAVSQTPSLVPQMNESRVQNASPTTSVPQSNESRLQNASPTPSVPQLSESRVQNVSQQPPSLAPQLNESRVQGGSSTPFVPQLSESRVQGGSPTPSAPQLNESRVQNGAATPSVPQLSESRVQNVAATPAVPQLSESRVPATINQNFHSVSSEEEEEEESSEPVPIVRKSQTTISQVQPFIGTDPDFDNENPANPPKVLQSLAPVTEDDDVSTAAGRETIIVSNGILEEEEEEEFSDLYYAVPTTGPGKLRRSDAVPPDTKDGLDFSPDEESAPPRPSPKHPAAHGGFWNASELINLAGQDRESGTTQQRSPRGSSNITDFSGFGIDDLGF